ncbi:MAG: ComF family protein [Sphingomonas sp.]|nr:ComF family protein [Sphingomonas sp.]MBX9796439.1 ComF family protein [Sphingomonas sp.]
MPLNLALDAALPPRCPGCGAVAAADHHFCAGCWSQLRFLAPPWCAACQTPFSISRGEGAMCARCTVRPPPIDGVLAAVAYDDISRAVVMRLKYGGHIALAETVARHMARLVPAEEAVLVPVPLHRWRLWRRGFNQSVLIAAALARLTGRPLLHDAVRRAKPTPVLRALGAAARARAVARAFAAGPGAAQLHGRAVLLVDDVYTSGATTAACAAVLRRAGAMRVTALCWARVLNEAEAD